MTNDKTDRIRRTESEVREAYGAAFPMSIGFEASEGFKRFLDFIGVDVVPNSDPVEELCRAVDACDVVGMYRSTEAAAKRMAVIEAARRVRDSRKDGGDPPIEVVPDSTSMERLRMAVEAASEPSSTWADERIRSAARAVLEEYDRREE